MTLSQALFLGVLQGVAEFLPISSSGHLALAQNWIGDVGAQSLLFNVVVHLGTLVAIVWVLRERLWKLVQAGLGLLLQPSERSAETATDRRWLLLIVVASIPTGIMGLSGREVVEQMNGEPVWIGVAFLCTAGLLLFSRRLGGGEKGSADLGWGDALWVGLLQGCGILPGLSRSGATIAAALARRVRPDTAVEFSVLVSVPAVIGANLLTVGAAGEGALLAEWATLAVGFFAASLTGIGALKALQWVVTRNHLAPFAAYCGLLGAGAIAVG